ncbi:MAG: hypothetical protein WA373_06940 [Burkholderiales bacterium]
MIRIAEVNLSLIASGESAGDEIDLLVVDLGDEIVRSFDSQLGKMWPALRRDRPARLVEVLDGHLRHDAAIAGAAALRTDRKINPTHFLSFGSNGILVLGPLEPHALFE